MDEENDEVLNNGEEKEVKEKNKNSAVKEKAKKKLKETIKKNAKKNSLMKVIGPLLIKIAIIILIIIIVIGILMFFVSMPGMVMEKLKVIEKEVAGIFARFFGEDSVQDVDNFQIYSSLNYIEEMGYDIKSFGFLTDYINSIDEVDSETKTDNGVVLDEEVGVLRNNDDEIITAKSDFIYNYIMSDNYVYTLKNKNNVAGSGTGGFWNGILGLGERFLDFLTFGQSSQYWSRGFIAIYYDNGILGNAGTFYKDSWLSGDKITLDASAKTLEIRKGHFNNSMTYSLDGWTGRYGMPIDFLISVHFATLMPDLAYDMATHFKTQLYLLLHTIGGGADNGNTAVGHYKVGNIDVTYDDFKAYATSGITGELNSWRISANEAKKIMIDFHIPSSPNCSNGEVKCDQTEEGDCCSECREYLQDIYDNLKSVNDKDLQTYQPYISKVEDHWYRDVYFVSDPNQKFVEYDYEYESVMKERWTLYETYEENSEKAGEYKLYRLDNGKLYEGTEQDAKEANIIVTKKAKTIKISDEMEDLNWHEEQNKLIAYELGDQPDQFDQVYKDIDESDEDYEIKKNIYANISIADAVKQTGEGQRAETNEDIKKMFLQNKYFRYDGGKETAEIITKLRNENDIPYGPLSDNDLEKTTEYNGKTYKVKDYAGSVTLTQDSLNAFSMLENTHTLDADYIYRDFKELIVELGYFKKEELTEETPRLLQWIVPDIGSYGYPKRVIDKNENEMGTMVHSEGDIIANNENILKELMQGIENAASQGPTGEGTPENNGGIGPVAGIRAPTMNIQNNVGNIDMNLNINMRAVGAVSEEAKSPEEVSIEEFLEAADKVHKDIEDNKFTYAQAVGDQTNYESALHTTKNVDCSAYVSWVLQEVGIFPKTKKLATGDESGSGMYGDEVLSKHLLTKEEAGELKPGDILLSSSHVQINGEDNIQYNAGNTGAIQSRPAPDNPTFYTHVIRLPFSGSSNKNANPYEGYKGNEAVVSPVTGVLLEYGTYTDEDKNSVTGEEYRVNVDMKYGTSQQINTDPNNPTPNNNGSQKVIDKVGYAKILVLDAENYQKLESLTQNSWQSSSLAKITKQEQNADNTILTNNFKNSKVRYSEVLENKDQLKDENWSDIDKTVYGYKEFAESYEKYGIAGYTIYIDGFKCELPDEELAQNLEESDNDDQIEEIPHGKELKFDDFKLTESNLNLGENSEDSVIQTKYEKDDEYKLASKKWTDRLNAESIIKEAASPVITVGSGDDELVLIKEGTVIGRTITDKELIVEYRDENYGTYEELRGDANSNNENPEEEKSKIIGNYLRVIMRDLDGTVIENVEDYMKLDDGNAKEEFSDFSEEFLYWMCVINEGMPVDNKSTFEVEHLNGDGMKTVGPGITMENAEKWFKETGHPEYNASTQLGTLIPKEIVIDAYLAWMDWYVEDINESFSRQLSESEIYAMCDYHHATGSSFKGFAYNDGVVLRPVNAGSGEEQGFLEDCNHVKPEYKEAIKKRRIADWKVYSEGRYTFTYDNGEDIKFDSKTPFQDAIKGIDSGHK